jgi:hypothetical protein
MQETTMHNKNVSLNIIADFTAQVCMFVQS